MLNTISFALRIDILKYIKHLTKSSMIKNVAVK